MPIYIGSWNTDEGIECRGGAGRGEGNKIVSGTKDERADVEPLGYNPLLNADGVSAITQNAR